MTSSNRITVFHLAFLVLLSLLLRTLGLGFGLPGPAFADEPHYINLAISFGSGNFDPQFFKYPTLWMYLLFIAFGGLFIFWSGFGLLKSVSDFAHLFVREFSLFALTARSLTVLTGSIGVIFIYRTALLLFESREAAFLSSLFYVICPPLIYFSHQAKPDTAMVMFAAMAWFFSIRYYQEGKDKDALLAGAVLGLACSTQYTAIITTPVLAVAHVMRYLKHKKESPLISRGIVAACLLIPTVFFLSSPFILIHFKTFLSDISDLRAYGSGAITTGSALAGWKVFYRLTDALGPRILGLILLTTAMGFLFLKRRESFWLVGFPLLMGALPLALQNQRAVIINYLFSLYPALFILVGSTWILMDDFSLSHRQKSVLAGLLCMPALVQTLDMDRGFLREDTRVSAKNWIETHIPPGSKILLDQLHTGPYLYPTKDQTERLIEKTKQDNPQRSLYYKLFLEAHPGGGYEIFLIQRTPAELISPLKRQTELAQKGHEWIDVENGLVNVRKAGVNIIVWSSKGATRNNSPRLIKFFDQLETEATPLAKFPTENADLSPLIIIYSLKNSRPAATQQFDRTSADGLKSPLKF